MKSILILISILIVSNAFADHALSDKARDVARQIWDKERDLKEDQVKDIDGYLDRIVGVMEKGTKQDLVCLESTQQPGKFCLKSLSGDNSCLGNYFSSNENCRDSLRVASKGYACYEGKSEPGKGLVAKVEENITRIGNWYPSFADCVSAMAGIRDQFVCMASERNPGKYHIGNLEKDGDIVGPYFGSLAECKTSLSSQP